MTDTIKAHAIFDEDERGNPTHQIAWIEPADEQDAKELINRPTNDEGRSEWAWVRLQNGTLMLATFPQGDTYLEFSDSGVCDFQWQSDEVQA